MGMPCVDAHKSSIGRMACRVCGIVVLNTPVNSLHRYVHPSCSRGQGRTPFAMNPRLDTPLLPHLASRRSSPPPLHFPCQSVCHHGGCDVLALPPWHTRCRQCRRSHPAARSASLRSWRAPCRRVARWRWSDGMSGRALTSCLFFAWRVFSFLAWLWWAGMRPGRWGLGAVHNPMGGGTLDFLFFSVASFWLCTPRFRGLCPLEKVSCSPLATVWGFLLLSRFPPPSFVWQLGCQPHDALLHHPYRWGCGAAGQYRGAVGRDAGHSPP